MSGCTSKCGAPEKAEPLFSAEQYAAMQRKFVPAMLRVRRSGNVKLVVGVITRPSMRNPVQLCTTVRDAPSNHVGGMTLRFEHDWVAVLRRDAVRNEGATCG